MPEELQTNEADSQEGSSDVSSELDISKLNEITGREFKDVDDFKKHYDNLKSFVGKKDEAKEKLTSILSKAEPFATKYGLEPDKFLEYYLTHPQATEDDIRQHFNQQKESRAKREDKELHSKVAKLEFLIEYPDAKADIKLIDTLAKGMGVSFNEAYNSEEYKRVATASRENKGTSVINSNSKVAMSNAEINKARQRLEQDRSDDAVAGYLKEIGIGEDK